MNAPNIEPVNVVVEQAVLGRYLAYPEVRAQLSDVHPDMFSEPAHVATFAAAQDLYQRDGGFSLPAILLRMGPNAALVELGGAEYLHRLAASAGPLSETTTDAETLRTVALARDLKAIMANTAAVVGHDPLAVLMTLESELQRLKERGCRDCALPTSRQVAETYFTCEDADMPGLMTGLSCIDERLGGLHAGHLVILAGRPAMGKTALLRNCLYGAARLNPTWEFIFFNLEMSGREISERAISALSYDDGEMVSYSRLARMPWAARQRWASLAAQLPQNVRIDDNRRLTVDRVRSTIWALKAKGRPVGAIGIDYLQLMTRPEARGRNEASVIGEMTAELKRIASETGTCIVLLSQLSRQVESRENKRPILSDLRDSGAIEQDASEVLFCYRDSYYRQREGGDSASDMTTMDDRVMEVITAKQRSGPIGTDRMSYYAEFDVIRSENPAASERRS
jgi:replicative DNA helicase